MVGGERKASEGQKSFSARRKKSPVQRLSAYIVPYETGNEYPGQYEVPAEEGIPGK